MRPVLGVSLEVAVLTLAMMIAPWVPAGLVYVLYVLIAEFLATYLIHCPAHYVVGRLVGLRFSNIRLGRTTLVNALPARFKPLARFLPILTLSTDKASLTSVSKSRIRAMYLSGTIASSGSALVIAAAVTYSGAPLAATLSWVLAAGYFIFDLVFSPRSGDVMRARAARRP